MDKELIKQKIVELKNKPQLTKKERKYLRKLEKKLGDNGKTKLKSYNSLFLKLAAGLFVILAIGGFAWYVLSQPDLPPMDMQGHIEQNPESHIMDSAIPDAVQRHMLEHADGDSANGPGVIIQYNCKKYTCEKDLVSKLTSIVKKYPKNVYLAPNDYDGKIILTREGQREILNEFNEEKIISFIAQ